MTVVGALRRNDPDTKCICIYLLDEAFQTTDEVLAQALEENPFVSLASFQSILQNKRNLTTLHFHDCLCIGEGQIRQDIISILSRPDSQLRCFEFQTQFEPLESVFPGIQFKNLLQAIQKSKLLERFSIGAILTLYQLQTLMQSIPSMPIRELKVVFDGQILQGNANLRQSVLLAIKNNFSLQSVKVEMLIEDEPGDDLFDSAEDKEALAFYANRNENLDQWVVHPEEVVAQRKVWPEALNLARRAGPDALFRGLRSVLECDYMSLPHGRKRKRVQN